MAASRMRGVLVLLALLSTLAPSPAAAGNNAEARYLVDGKVERAERAASGFARAIGGGGGDNDAAIMAQKYAIDAAEEAYEYTLLETNTIHEVAGDPDAPYQLRGSMHRRLDLEDMLQEMARKNPEEWEASEWLIMILFLSFFGWLGCCLCSLCCCGRGGGSNLLGWLCFWEICCRGGDDIDRCCDYALA
ncbi:hypothetical protein ACHAXT_008689 [Thalassiosira profunda]